MTKTAAVAAAIHELECMARKEPDRIVHQQQLAMIGHLKNGPDRPLGNEFIARQADVMAGTYQPPEVAWLRNFRIRKETSTQ